MMDEVLMRMGIRKQREGIAVKWNVSVLGCEDKKKGGEFIKFKRGKSYKEELRTQEDEFMLYSLK